MRAAPIDHDRFAGLRVVAILAILAVGGCGKKVTNPDANPDGTTTYTGSATGAVTSGKLTIILSTTTPAPQAGAYRAPRVIPAGGTFALTGGAAVNLSGSYENVGKSVAVTGGGWTFTGDVTSVGIEGIFTGPGPVNGVFSLQSGSNEVTVVVGTYTSLAGGENGRFNFSIKGSEVHGNAVSTTGVVTDLDGTYTAATGAISIANPGGGAALDIGTYYALSGQATGTYNDGAGDNGDWTGTKQP
jgi:hypothetical protein